MNYMMGQVIWVRWDNSNNKCFHYRAIYLHSEPGNKAFIHLVRQQDHHLYKSFSKDKCCWSVPVEWLCEKIQDVKPKQIEVAG